MSDLIETMPEVSPPEIPIDWDFETADKNFDEAILGWRRFTGKVIAALWIFYDKLKIGHRPKSSQNWEQLPTWEEWLQKKGISKNTPTNHFRKLGWLSPGVHFLSESNEWTTPATIIEKTELIFGQIDLDPCSDVDHNIPSLQRFTLDDDGLTRDWIGRIYMNPPYGRELPDWVKKFKSEHLSQNMTEGIALIPARPDTDWFYTLRDYPRCFIRHRLKFGGQQNSAPFPSMVVYAGNNIEKFKQAFQDTGDIYQRIID